MNTKLKKIFITTATTLSAILIVSTATYAIGTLTPTGTAGDDTQYSLNDIYDKLTNFSDTPTATSSPFTVPGTATSTFATLSEIYGLLEAEEADLVAGNIKQGETIFGVAGEYTAAPTTLEWSTDQGSMNWDTASSTCATLTEGGATAGDWRLPTISELLAGISDDWIVEGDNEGDRFANITYYWSGTGIDSGSAWLAGWDGIVNYGIDFKTNTLSVRCVR